MIRRATCTARRRAGATAATVLAVAACGLLVPAGSAQAMTLTVNMYDVDDNGWDPYVQDSSGNNVWDRNLISLPGDQVVYAWLIDDTEDYMPEEIQADIGGDGTIDLWFFDKDQNDVWEGIYGDANRDRRPDVPQGVSFSIIPPPNPTSDWDYARFCPADPFWCFGWPRVPSVPTGALPPGVSIAAGLNAVDGAAANNGLL